MDPIKLTVCMYNVGFGDSILLTFEYASPPTKNDPRTTRHMLIDCGTKAPVDGGLTRREIAELVKTHCDKQLDVVVVTHRHSDHMSIFDPKDGGDVLKKLKPKLVIRSWTEDPTLGAKAKTPTGMRGAAFADLSPSTIKRIADEIPDREIGAASVAFAGLLIQREQQVRTLARRMRAVGGISLDGAHASTVLGAASGAMPNLAAVKNLEAMAGPHGGRYVYYGKPSGITGRILPGVTAEVLSPPTPDQYKKITGRATDRPDYLLRATARLSVDGLANLIIDTNRPKLPANADVWGPGRWIIDKLSVEPVDATLGVVRWLDNAMNNTSVVLLITVAGKKLLFPGDAQGESWDWILKASGKAAENCQAIADIDFYKVGHHGSRNATPQGLLDLWKKRPGNKPILAGMSTLPGVHKGGGEGEVPRIPLINAMKKLPDFTLRSTTDKSSTKFIMAECDLKAGTPFKWRYE